ncbi:MAG: molybdopterin molybdotransferase MoeA [Ideonella sp.]|nr:molybdopterin molybdotransferase MoeA [Ideonella sp.]MCC7456048.1 molybdopterin molybdotransferase MoeA [Nitrospira sp.]
MNTASTRPPDRAPLLSLDEAVQRLLAGARGHGATQREAVSTFDALGRVLADDVRSALNVPPEDNSSMDGYALRVADVPAAGTVLRVSQRIPAGHVGTALEPGTAARIFTGAQIPAGADAVVMQEQCEAIAPAGEGLGSVRLQALPEHGRWIRRRGEDVQRDAVVLRAGTRLTPPAMGLAASVGAAQLQVWRRPRVALFSTGDELAMPGEVLRPGAIYNSNRFTLRGLLQAAGCEAIDLGIVPDRLDATREALRRAAAQADVVLTCGGVSVGEEDHLKPALQAEGRLDLWQIALKPGKPLAFGAVRRADGAEALYVGLPGNPVSAAVTFLIAVMPLLRAIAGAAPAGPAPITMTAGFDWSRPDRRREFLRARVGGDGRLELFANQSSGVLTSMVWADGLIDNPPGQAIAAGDAVRFLPLPLLLA